MSRQEFINPHGVFVLATLPDFLLTSRDLTFGAKLTYSVLCSLSGPDGSCSLPQTFLASKLGLSTIQLKRYVRELKLNGYITASRGSRRNPNTYRFLWRPEWANLRPF